MRLGGHSGHSGHRYGRVLPPLVLFLFLAVVELAALVGRLPSPQSFVRHVGTNPVVIFVVALGENTVGINAAFPGSVAILASMSMTAGDIRHALTLFAAIVVGSGIGQTLSFVTGRIMSKPYTDEVRHRVGHILAGLASYWHPQMGSILSYRRGASAMSLAVFARLLLLTWLPWNVFWGVLMYSVGSVIVTGVRWDLVFVVYSAAWLLWEMRAVRRGAPESGTDAQAGRKSAG